MPRIVQNRKSLQVTIPKEFAEALRWKPGNVLYFKQGEKDEAILKRLK